MKLLTTTILIFSGILAVMVGLRLDQQTMAILTGTAIGFVVAAVCIGIVAYIVLNRKPMPKTEHEPATQTPLTYRTPRSPWDCMFQLRGWRSSMFGVWAAQARPEKGGVASPSIFLELLPSTRGRPDKFKM